MAETQNVMLLLRVAGGQLLLSQLGGEEGAREGARARERAARERQPSLKQTSEWRIG